MTANRLSIVLAYAGGVLLLATAALHQSGYGSVTTQAEQGPPELKPLVAVLWVAFTVALALCALLVFVLAPSNAPTRRVLLVIAALNPLSAAVLQVVYLGFVPPTAILLFDALVVAGAAIPRHARQPVSAPAA